MALVKCPDCGTEVSDRAPSCPKCGAPRPADAPPFSVTSQGRKTHPVTWIVTALVLGVIGYYSWQSNRLAALPRMPVSVQYRKALLGPGYVVIVENNSSTALPLMASVSHAAVNDSRRYDLLIAANGRAELGKLQGWAGQSGDHITLENAHYRPWSGSLP